VNATSTLDGKDYGRSRTEFKSNSVCKLTLAEATGPEDWGGELIAFNSMYGFTLGRKAPDAPWVLKDLAMGDNRHNRTGWEAYDQAAVLGWTTVDNVRLADLVREPNFRVTGAKAIERDGAELIQIDFDNTHVPAAPLYILIQSGMLLLDPDRFWMLRGFDVRDRSAQGEHSSKGEYEVRSSSTKAPIPKRLVQVSKGLMKGGRVMTITKEYDLSEVTTPPGEEEFTLSAFGLPEPQGVIWQKPSRWYLWFIGVGVACLVIGAYLWHRLHRHKMTHPKAIAKPSGS
jgi:hypothetical protein